MRETLRATLMFLCLASMPDAVHAVDTKEAAMKRILIRGGGQTLAATLDDSTAARDFADMLPLELTLNDYHGIEKVADLPRKIDMSDAPASYEPAAGDITVYAPWGNLAIFYKPFQSSRGLVRLGEFNDDVDALQSIGDGPVRIELAQ